MKKAVYIFITLITVAWFAGCSNERVITIITTNDIHGAIDNFASLATLVKQHREENPTGVLLVDAGDKWTGNPYVDLALERGQPIIEMMNSLGYDLATHGNHDFDFGIGVLSDREKGADFSTISANINSECSTLPQPSPYHYIEIKGIKLCFLGLITTAHGGYPEGFRKNYDCVEFADPFVTAHKYETLRDSCDVFIGLTHIGYEMDSVLAMQMPQLDLILGGHTHTVLPEGRKIANTLITHGGTRLKYASVTTIKFKGRKLTAIENRLVKLDSVAPDPKYAAMVEAYKSVPELQVVQGEASTAFSKTGILNLLADMIRVQTNSDLALYNRGGVRIDSIMKGEVTLADVYSLEPFGNIIVERIMTQNDLKEMILTKFNSHGKESHRDDLYPSGFSYTIVKNDKGDGVDVKFNYDVRIPKDGRFKVGMSNYVSSSYKFGSSTYEQSTETVIAKALSDYLKKNSPVAADNTMRIKQ